MRERRYPLGLKAMIATAALSLLVAVVAGLGLVVSVLGLFGSSADIEDRIRPDLVAEADVPTDEQVRLVEGSYAVYVISETDDLPSRSRSVRLDVRVTAEDGTVVPYEPFAQPATYQDPRSGAELAWVGDVDVDRAGTYRIEARRIPGAAPIDGMGIGETPGFGAAALPWVGGFLVTGIVGAGALTAASGFAIGAAVWASTLPRRDRPPLA